jgi:magnesium chelatase family protein
MLSVVFSGATVGLDGVLVKVEVDSYSRGFPGFTIVGLPDKAIEESKERVKAAIKNSGFFMPDTKLVVNLAPADIPKEGSMFDLPIAVGIIAATEKIKKTSLDKSIFIGELSLEGKIRPVPGALSIAYLARAQGMQSLFVPAENAYEAAMVEGIDVYAVESLQCLVLHLNQEIILNPYPCPELKLAFCISEGMDFADIKGQYQAKRAVEIVACGMHNIHLKGPPGAGKTLIARSLPSIMPLMDREEIIEVSKIYSILKLTQNQLILQRPFRSPHHTISRVGLIGGGTKLTPGEISLSHRGILFLDEFPEFPRSVVESLRQPLEDGNVTISRAQGSANFPCRFLLVAASNPCPCGFLGHPKKNCRCSFYQVEKYRKRVSGPILDRIDLHIDVPALEEKDYSSNDKAEGSELIRNRVMEAKGIQNKRFENTRIKSNGEMTSSDVKKFCRFSIEAEKILKQAIDKLSLSARSYFKIIKVSQTISDLNSHSIIEDQDVLEALQYRVKE